MAERDILICWPVSRSGSMVPGSLTSKCSKCGEPVWLSPSSLLLLHDTPGMDIQCVECGRKQMISQPGEVRRPTPAQLDEIREYLKGAGR